MYGGTDLYVFYFVLMLCKLYENYNSAKACLRVVTNVCKYVFTLYNTHGAVTG